MKMKKIDPMQEQLRLQEMYQYEKYNKTYTLDRSISDL